LNNEATERRRDFKVKVPDVLRTQVTLHDELLYQMKLSDIEKLLKMIRMFLCSGASTCKINLDYAEVTISRLVGGSVKNMISIVIRDDYCGNTISLAVTKLNTLMQLINESLNRVEEA
jgi:hypothetical protein